MYMYMLMHMCMFIQCTASRVLAFESLISGRGRFDILTTVAQSSGTFTNHKLRTIKRCELLIVSMS